MRPFEYFDHTADTRFRAYGKDFDDALANLVLAVYNVVVDTSTVLPVVRRDLSVAAASRRALVYDLIDELVFLMDTESFLGCRVESCRVEEADGSFRASLTIVGDTDASQYDVFSQVKSATYSEMEFGEENGNVFIQAVVDL